MLRARDVPASQMLLIHLMNRTVIHADLGELELFKRDVGLSYKLLCYVNSAGMGLRYKITSVRHALTMIGHQQLYRWLTLMLALSGQGSYPALTSIAITRGRLMEPLGFRSGLVDEKDQEGANRMFITGMLLLDALLSVPMATILQRLKLDPTVEEALAEHTGPHGAYLDLIDASERNDMQKMGSLGDHLRLDTSTVCKSIFEAMAWTENVAV